MIPVDHRGAQSGTASTSPLVSMREGENSVVIASKGGAPEEPQWFHNLVANPDITVEGDERDRLDQAQADAMPSFAECAKGTNRVIPVVVLEPA
ncbi:MAG: nitroreductase/quinone reductase family protein [Ilumatobacteraceae bacterium]